VLFTEGTGVTWPQVVGPIAAVFLLLLGWEDYRDGHKVRGTFVLLLSPVILLFVYWILLYAIYAVFGVVVIFLVWAALQ